MHRRFVIDHAAVASDIIDGEAIILHHTSGDYFSADGTGALIWKWICEAKSREEILGALEGSFPGASGEIAVALDAFLADLLKHELMAEVKPDGEMTNGTTSPGKANSLVADSALTLHLAKIAGRFSPPVLHVYSDMRDVLLVDPIHEVEEAAGWPVPKRAK
jgi:coenzyme PQQ synthesis protein D (PqqD)